MLGTEFFPSLHFHRTWQWPRQEMISSVLIVLMKNKMSNLHSAVATLEVVLRYFHRAAKGAARCGSFVGGVWSLGR
jgi:hypothetical protein